MTPSAQTWVRMRSLARSDYAENGISDVQGLRPTFFSVLKAKAPLIKTLRAEIQQLPQEIARITGHRTENIHILYLPPAVGRISFGGTLIE